ncbi:unnamed protein product [Ectocarpus sp. CCAP 1310/34]|nr:unnamed protein product [Ectocarpus sp. CCAP 1310/34]
MVAVAGAKPHPPRDLFVDVVKEILFLRQIWRFMLPQVGMPCIPVFEDNQGAIQLAQNPISNSNSKHIDVRHHFLRELVERKEISAIHVPSPYQHADFHTYEEFVEGCFRTSP